MFVRIDWNYINCNWIKTKKTVLCVYCFVLICQNMSILNFEVAKTYIVMNINNEGHKRISPSYVWLFLCDYSYLIDNFTTLVTQTGRGYISYCTRLNSEYWKTEWSNKQFYIHYRVLLHQYKSGYKYCWLVSYNQVWRRV